MYWPFLHIVYILWYRQTTVLNKALFLLSVLPFVARLSFKCWVIIPFRDESKQHGSHGNYKHAVSCWMSHFLLVVFWLSCVCRRRRLGGDHWWMRTTRVLLVLSTCSCAMFKKKQLSSIFFYLIFSVLENQQTAFASIFSQLFSSTSSHMSSADTRCGQGQAAPMKSFWTWKIDITQKNVSFVNPERQDLPLYFKQRDFFLFLPLGLCASTLTPFQLYPECCSPACPQPP